MTPDAMFWVTMGMSGAMILLLVVVLLRACRNFGPGDWDLLFPAAGSALAFAAAPWLLWGYTLVDPIKTMAGGVLMCGINVLFYGVLAGPVLIGLVLAGLAGFVKWFFKPDTEPGDTTATATRSYSGTWC